MSIGDGNGRRVHPDREHVAHCQRRGRSDTGQTDGNAPAPADPNESAAS